ncbi:hypothetical protein ACQPYK_30975 [Streptosporangium sp. CA-135522]|uniref:hypothetical protein n=1 Tax=Streptosporangium sp. CA-135522 TaxID=3240072 RepID=UPI003D8E29AD
MGGEGVEKREARVTRHQLVVPLQQELDRDGDPGRRLGQGFVAREAEDGGVRAGRDRPYGADRPPGESERAHGRRAQSLTTSTR